MIGGVAKKTRGEAPSEPARLNPRLQFDDQDWVDDATVFGLDDQGPEDQGQCDAKDAEEGGAEQEHQGADAESDGHASDRTVAAPSAKSSSSSSTSTSSTSDGSESDKVNDADAAEAVCDESDANGGGHRNCEKLFKVTPWGKFRFCGHSRAHDATGYQMNCCFDEHKIQHVLCTRSLMSSKCGGSMDITLRLLKLWALKGCEDSPPYNALPEKKNHKRAFSKLMKMYSKDWSKLPSAGVLINYCFQSILVELLAPQASLKHFRRLAS